MRKIVFIVGQTASGKSALSINIAKKHKVEIICADSKTIYKDANIGTAKPSIDDQKIVHHHCIDILDPNESYSVARFQSDSKVAMGNIFKKNKDVLVVGGTGLYVDSLFYNYEFIKNNKDKIDRTTSLNKLIEIAEQNGLRPTSETMTNKQHLIRFIERNGVSKKGKKLDALVVGLELDTDNLKSNITSRVEGMYKDGLVDETRKLIDIYGENCPVLKAPAYIATIAFLKGEVSLDQAKEMFVKLDMKLAKKQKTWFRRNKDINWFNNKLDAEQLIDNYLLQ